jgi:hypothetical protein
MRVYCVFIHDHTWDGEGDKLKHIFSSKIDAEKYRKRGDNWCNYSIEEWEVKDETHLAPETLATEKDK